MENLFEFIVPIVFFIIWVVSGIFNKAKEGSENAPPARQQSPQREQNTQSEQARRIREEIRRKIEQRKNESQQAPETQQQRRYDPNKPYGQQSHPAQQYQEQKAPPLPQQQTQEPEYNDTWENESSSDNTYDLDKLQQQIKNTRKRVAETEQAANALNANDLTASNPYQYKEEKDPWAKDITGAKNDSTRGDPQNDIAAILKDPKGARKGFLYYEILGQPVGSRRNEQTGPFWK